MLCGGSEVAQQIAMLGLWLSVGVMLGSVLAGQLYAVGDLRATRRYGWLLAAGIAVLGSIGWQGIFELEFMRSSDGAFTTLDLNPRTYGSMALAIRAGADLPALWCEWLLGGRPDPVFARPGFHYRWEDAELRRLVWEIRRGSLSGAAAVLRRGPGHRPRRSATGPSGRR